VTDGAQAYGQQKPQIKEGTMRAASILICDVIERLDMFADGPYEKKSVLCFLPGLAEIFQFMDFVQEWYKTEEKMLNTLVFIPLHSSLNESEQNRAFD